MECDCNGLRKLGKRLDTRSSHIGFDNSLEEYLRLVQPSSRTRDYAGIYREEGVNVTNIFVRSTGDVNNALITGGADFTGAIQTVIEAVAAGYPLKVVLATQHQSFAIVARPGVQSMYNVKTIAFHSRNVVSYMMSTYLLDHGIDPANVEYRFVGSTGLLPAILGPANSPTACDVSTLDASTYDALKANCTILWHFAQEHPDFLMSGLATTGKVIVEKPEVVKSMVKAVYRSLAYIMTHKEEAITYAMQRFNIDRAYATFIYEWTYEKKSTEIHLSLQQIGLPTNMLNYTMQISAQYLKVEPKPLETWVDASFWNQAKRDLGLS